MQESQSPDILSLLPEPLELLPELEQDMKPQFAIDGLQQLTTDSRFKPLEQIFEMSTQTSIITESLQREIQMSRLFKDTVYQKYDSGLEPYKTEGLIRCILSKYVSPRICQQLKTQEEFKVQLPEISFDSKFQSGNLGRVSQISANQYNLLLDNDVNTKGFTQWFFFKVSVSHSCTVTFNLMNFRKKQSLYQRGMKICVYSRRKSEEGWRRGGTNIQYFENGLIWREDRKYFTLRFSYTFDRNDSVFFSYHYPYTYSDLIKFINSLKHNKVVKKSILSSTSCGNKVYCLTITEQLPKYQPQHKKYVIIMARTHPGETISSFLMEKLIKFLTSNEKEAVELRHMFIFKIIPMINPDGVLHGNSRCSLPGRDLNRSWDRQDPILYPEIYSIKKMIDTLYRSGTIEMICDFHGHSIKKDAFIYGCHKKSQPFATRQFPWILSKLCKNFNYGLSSFSNAIGKKEGTARVNLFRQYKITQTFTLQTSFCGPSRSVFHWSQEDLKDLAKSFCLTLHVLNRKPKKMQPDQNYEPQHNAQVFLSELYKNKQNYQCGLHQEYSSSEVEDDYISEAQLQSISAKPAESPKRQRKSIQKHTSSEVELYLKESPVTLIKGRRHSRVQSTLHRSTVNKSPDFTRVVKGRIAHSRTPMESQVDQKIEMENIKIWLGGDLPKLQQRKKPIGRKLGVHSRTESSTNEIILKKQKLQLSVQYHNFKVKDPTSRRNHDESPLRKRERRASSKQHSSSCVLPQKIDNRFKNSQCVAFQKCKAPYRASHNPTALLREIDSSSPVATNFIRHSFQKKQFFFQKQLLQKIDRRLQNYIEVYKLNRMLERTPVQKYSTLQNL